MSNNRMAGRELLIKIKDRLGVDGLVSVDISARRNEAVIMRLERIVSIDEMECYLPEIAKGSITSKTTVKVDDNTRVTFGA